jgi:hypothetical protein
MSTSRTKFRRAYVPATALAKSVRFDDEMMHVKVKTAKPTTLLVGLIL